MSAVSRVFATLGNESRLTVLRRLIEQGPDGATAGEVGLALSVPPSTLSFHLNKLQQADLVTCRRDGRTLVYTARSSTIDELISHLDEHYTLGAVTAVTPRGTRLRASEIIPAIVASVVSLFGSNRNRRDKPPANGRT